MVDTKKRGKIITGTLEDDKDINFEGIITEILMRLASVEKLLLNKKVFTKEEFAKEIEANVEKFKDALNIQVKEFKDKKGIQN